MDYNIPVLFRIKSAFLSSENLIQDTTDPETTTIY